MLKLIDHLGVAVRDLGAAVETMKKTGELRLGKEEEIPAFKVKAIMIATGDHVPIELIEPTSPDSGVAKFLDKRGEGLHHVAYRVDDVAAALEALKAQGFRAIDDKPRPGYGHSQVAFLHPKDLLGVLTELVEREPGRDVPPYDPA